MGILGGGLQNCSEFFSQKLLTLWGPGYFGTSEDQGGPARPQGEIAIVAHKMSPEYIFWS